MDRNLKEKIISALIRTNSNIKKVAQECRTTISIVEHVDIALNKRYNMTPEGLGPKHLQKYIIGRVDLSKGEEYNNNSPKIYQARLDYNAGLCEITTGRDGFFAILYAIPRKKRAPAREYFEFSTENVVELGAK